MASERQRLIELALESLWNRKKEIDKEIEELTRELGGRRGIRAAKSPQIITTAGAGRPRKRSTFTKEERLRRSQRMKAYWDKWRKEKKGQK